MDSMRVFHLTCEVRLSTILPEAKEVRVWDLEPVPTKEE